MILHTSPTAIYVKSDRDLSHIELAQSDNISSSSTARTYRVNIGVLKTKYEFWGSRAKLTYRQKEKTRARIEGFFPFTLALFCRYKGLGLAHSAFVRTNAMLALGGSLQILR